MMGTAVDDEGGGDNLKKIKNDYVMVVAILKAFAEKIINGNNICRKVSVWGYQMNKRKQCLSFLYLLAYQFAEFKHRPLFKLEKKH